MNNSTLTTLTTTINASSRTGAINASNRSGSTRIGANNASNRSGSTRIGANNDSTRSGSIRIGANNASTRSGSTRTGVNNAASMTTTTIVNPINNPNLTKLKEQQEQEQQEQEQQEQEQQEKKNKEQEILYPLPGKQFINNRYQNRTPVPFNLLNEIKKEPKNISSTNTSLSSAALSNTTSSKTTSTLATPTVQINNGSSTINLSVQPVQEPITGGYIKQKKLNNKMMREILKKNNINVTKNGKYLSKKQLIYQLKKINKN